MLLARTISSRKFFGALLGMALLAPAAWSAQARWVTFKTGRDAGRILEHQIVRQAGQDGDGPPAGAIEPVRDAGL
jgi:hypothetical protein